MFSYWLQKWNPTYLFFPFWNDVTFPITHLCSGPFCKLNEFSAAAEICPNIWKQNRKKTGKRKKTMEPPPLGGSMSYTNSRHPRRYIPLGKGTMKTFLICSKYWGYIEWWVFLFPSQSVFCLISELTWLPKGSQFQKAWIAKAKKDKSLMTES